MSNLASANRCNSFCLGIKKRNVQEVENTTGKTILTFLLVSMVCAACFLYIYQVNKLATMGYEIKKSEKMIEDLKQKNQLLKVEAAGLKSIHNIEQKKDEMNLRKPDAVSYVEIENAILVSR